MSLALAATTAAALFGIPKLPPKLPSPVTPTPIVPQAIEPDCSATKRIELPPLRVFGMAPTRGVDWLLYTRIGTTLNARVVPLPRGIDVVLRLSSRVPDWGTTEYLREQHLRLPVTPPSGCEVSHTSVAPDTVVLRGLDKYERVHGAGFIDEAECMNDTTKPEKTNETGCRRVKLEPIMVHFRKKSAPSCGTIQFQPPPVDAMRMKQVVRGNEGFSTSEAYVEIDVESETTGNRVKLTTRVTIEEDHGDRSRFTSDWIGSTVFDAATHAPGCKVTSVENATGRLRDRAKYTKDAGYRPTLLDGSAPGTARRGVVKSAGCRAGTGYDWRKLGCMVNFNPITIHLAPA